MTESLKGLRICYFGHYDPDYSRNRILRKALERAGAEIIEVNCRARGLLRFANLFIRAMRRKFDLMLVGFPGHTDMPNARLICSMKNVPLIFDAFVSLYDSNVFDRGLVRPGSLSSCKLFRTDKAACRLADAVLLDTDAHIQFFHETFGVPMRKLYRIRAASDDEIMYPREGGLEKNVFTIFFYGSFIPLHGVEHIIEAASILQNSRENIHFIVVGEGQTFAAMKKKAEGLNLHIVNFAGRVSYEELPVLMQQSDICLGIFGTTPKAARVIPNKVFDALAMGKCVITADTPAIREILIHGENVWLCVPGSGQALASAILTLKQNDAVRERIAFKGYDQFKEHFSINAISKEIKSIILHIRK